MPTLSVNKRFCNKKQVSVDPWNVTKVRLRRRGKAQRDGYVHCRLAVSIYLVQLNSTKYIIGVGFIYAR